MMFCLLGDPLCSKQINPLEYIRLALNVLWGALLNARKLNNPQGRFNAEVTSWTYTEGVQPPGRKIWLSVIFQIWLSQKNIKIIHFFLKDTCIQSCMLYLPLICSVLTVWILRLKDYILSYFILSLLAIRNFKVMNEEIGQWSGYYHYCVPVSNQVPPPPLLLMKCLASVLTHQDKHFDHPDIALSQIID